MKKIVIAIIISVLLLPFINIPFVLLANVNFSESDLLTQKLEENLAYCKEGECSETFISYYGDFPEKALSELIKVDFSEIEKREAIRLLAFKEIDKISKYVVMPTAHIITSEENKLFSMQFFNINGEDYAYCRFRDGAQLYSYKSTQELNSALDKECFLTEGVFRITKENYIKNTVFYLLSRYLPVLGLIVVMLVPYLIFTDKKMQKKSNTDIAKKAVSIAKAGIFCVPLIAICCLIYVYCSINS